MILLLAACDQSHDTPLPSDSLEQNSSDQTASDAEYATEETPHTHEFGSWSIAIAPTYEEEGLKIRSCACGETQTEAIPKKEPQTVHIGKENFTQYFDILYEFVYSEYEGEVIMNYGTIDVAVACAQSFIGETKNVTVTLALYPIGGRWDDTNFDSDDREVFLDLSTLGAAAETKHMGFATTKPLTDETVREPDRIDIVVVSATGTITVYEDLNSDDRPEGSQPEDSVPDGHTHSFGDWNTTRNATCAEDGVKERQCACGHKETATIAKQSHQWKEPTCTEPRVCTGCQAFEQHPLGHDTDCGICGRCGEEYYSPYQAALKNERQRHEDELGRIDSEVTRLDAQYDMLMTKLNIAGISYLNSASYYYEQINSLENTLSNKRSQYASYLASGDSYNANRLANEIAGLEDDLVFYYVCCEYAEERDELTTYYSFWEEQQLNELYYHAASLERIEQEYQAEIYLLQYLHIDLEWIVITPATCTKSGLEHYQCKYCDLFIPREIEPLGHNVKESTCTDGSYCTTCNEVYASALGHDWIFATCTTPTYCTRCAQTDGAASGHSLVSYEAKDASCSSSGHNAYEACMNCDYTTFVEIARLPHSCPNGWTVVKETGYYEEGLQTAICDHCGNVEEVIPCLPTSQGLTFALNFNNGYTWTGMGTCTDTCIVVPDTYNGLPVNEVKCITLGVDHVTELVIPPSITYIERGSFMRFKNLEKITLPFIGTSPTKNKYFASVFDTTTNTDFSYAFVPKTLKTVVLTHETSLSNNAFDSCSKIEQIILNEGITQIGDSTFNGCSSLKSMILPDSVTTIGSNLFTSCSALTEVTFGSGITSIPYETFKYCGNLTKITLPDSVTEFETGAFYNCTKLAEIVYNGTMEEWDSIYKANVYNSFSYSSPWDGHLSNAYTITCKDGIITR